MLLNKVLNQALSKLKQSKIEQRQLECALKDFIKIIKPNLSIGKLFIGGSYAKGTMLKGTKEIDIFVMFDYKKFKNKNSELSMLLESKLNQSRFKFERLHGSRDYFSTTYSGVTFEIIPILEIGKPEQALNITDISPLHVKWVLKNINEGRRSTVLLLKGLLKANMLYGAESYIQGFSGYVCEILGIYYNNFVNLLNSVAKWKPCTFIDSEQYYRTKDEALINLNASKVTPLLIIDPVQKTRNAAAAVNRENMLKFITLAKEFLSKPSINYFKKKQLNINEIKMQYPGKPLVWLEATPLPKKRDVAGAKLLKLYKRIIRECKDYGFKLMFSDWEWDEKSKARFVFVFGSKLRKIRIVKGPRADQKEHAARFKTKHSSWFIKQGKLMAKEMREYTEPDSFIRYLIALIGKNYASDIKLK